MTLKLVAPVVSKYPQVKGAIRPFRIWDSKELRNVPHRCYSTERRALDGALLLVRWSKVGLSLEVYDVNGGRWLGTYTRRVYSIAFQSKSS
jgi:hypothetical protein